MSKSFGGLVAAVALIVGAIAAFAPSAQAAPTPAFITDCQPTAPLCTQSDLTSGSFRIKTFTLTLPAGSIRLRQGISFADTNNTYIVYPPPSGQQLTSTPVTVPGGLLGQFPGIGPILAPIFGPLVGPLNVLKVSQSLAGPITLRHRTDADADEYTIPLTLKLENPALGNNCKISPVILKVGPGPTNPPPPNTSISGSNGTSDEELPYGTTGGFYTVFHGVRFVDNAFAVPKATGCGPLGIASPIVNLSMGLPSAAGNNAVILDQDLSTALNPTIFGP